MATEYTWVISQLDAYPQQDNHTDVVMTIHWRRQATDGTYSADIYGSQSVTLAPDAPFTPFADLTEAQVIGWLEEAFGPETLAAQKASLDQQIANQINPPVISPPLPWAAPPAPDMSAPSN
jgi:hypothetical protein